MAYAYAHISCPHVMFRCFRVWEALRRLPLVFEYNVCIVPVAISRFYATGCMCACVFASLRHYVPLFVVSVSGFNKCLSQQFRYVVFLGVMDVVRTCVIMPLTVCVVVICMMTKYERGIEWHFE